MTNLEFYIFILYSSAGSCFRKLILIWQLTAGLWMSKITKQLICLICCFMALQHYQGNFERHQLTSTKCKYFRQ